MYFPFTPWIFIMLYQWGQSLSVVKCIFCHITANLGLWHILDWLTIFFIQKNECHLHSLQIFQTFSLNLILGYEHKNVRKQVLLNCCKDQYINIFLSFNNVIIFFIFFWTGCFEIVAGCLDCAGNLHLNPAPGVLKLFTGHPTDSPLFAIHNFSFILLVVTLLDPIQLRGQPAVVCHDIWHHTHLTRPLSA